MKQFCYEVGGFEFIDTVAFGTAWKEAKAKAAEMHVAIYRVIRKDGEEKTEVFCTGGCFIRADLAEPKNIKIF